MKFNAEIVFYRKSRSLSLEIGFPHKADSPPPLPLFIVSSYEQSCSKQSETLQRQLYNGPTDTYPVIGDVQFRRLTTSDMNNPACNIN